MSPATPANQVAVRLDLQLKSADEPITYAGEVEVSEAQFAITVLVGADAKAADGLCCSATAAELPDALRARVERLAASMARKAVRGARKDGLQPPRRIRRWRGVQG